MKQTKLERSFSRQLIRCLAAGCLLTVAGCATSGNRMEAGTGGTPDRFAQADTNRDGTLTADEASDYFVSQIFASRDFNHDGKLTWAEWNVPGADRSRSKFDAADANKDGSLSLEEALAYGRKRHAFEKEFKAADTNHDGHVSRDEAQSFQASTEGPPQ